MERKKDSGNNETNFYVYWDIVKDFTVIDSSQEDACVFVRDRFLGAAKAVFALDKPSYTFLLTGYEPTLHPLLPDLLAYLFRQKASVHVLLRTGARQDEAFFEKLLALCPKNAFELAISLHPEEHDESHIEKILTVVFQHNQRASVTLHVDDSNQEAVRDWGKKLADLRKTVPFGFTLTKSDGLTDVLDAFDAHASQGPVCLPSLAFDACSGKEPAVSDECYCCVGSNLLYIAPNGQYAPACNALVPLRKLNIWNAGKKTLSKLAHIEQCHDRSLLSGANSVLPVFSTREEALAWLREHESREQSSSLEVRGGIPQSGDILRSRLRRLQPLVTVAGQIEADPKWVEASLPAFGSLYETLDGRSREILLRAMKCVETGDLAYLPQCAAQAYHFEAQEGEVFFVGSEAKERVGSKGKIYSITDESKGIDAFCREEGELCSGLLIDVNDDDFAIVRNASQTLVDYSPRVLVRTENLKLALTLPLWLRERCPDHTILLCRDTEGDAGLCIVAEPKVAPARYFPEPGYPRPILSVLVLYDVNDPSLSRCVESVLCHECADVELILVGADVPDEAKSLIARYPGRVKTLCVGERGAESSRAYALNGGLDMALGQYVTFLEPKDVISWEFLPKSLELIKAEHPDIITFDRVLSHRGRYEHYAVESTTTSGVESLEDFLLEKAGPCTLQGRLFHVDRLRQLRIDFSEFGKETDFAFAFLAHYHSRKTLVVPETGCFQEKTSDDALSFADDHPIVSFGAFVSWFCTFCKRHDLDAESPMYSRILTQAYYTQREELFYSLADAVDDEDSEEFSETVLTHLTASRELFCAILKDYALLYCQRENLNPTVADDSLDWERKSSEKGTLKYEVYSDGTQAVNPALTVILSGSRYSELPATLESLVAQDTQEYECLIVDDGRQADRYELLQNYADLNPNFRLYRMSEPADADTCRNIAFEKAKGRYVLFLEDGDICQPGCFAKVLDAFEGDEVDIVCFSTEEVDSEGNVVSTEDCGNEVYGETRCADFVAEKLAAASLLGKVFDRNCLDRTISNNGFSFRDLAQNISCVVTSSYVAFSHRAEGSYGEFQASYPKLRILYHVLSSLQTDEEKSAEATIGRLLQHVAAYWQTSQCVPMTDEDFSLLSRNPNCLRALLCGFAKLFEESDEEKSVLPTASLASTSVYDIAKTNQPFLSLYSEDFLPSAETVRALRETPALFTQFMTEYASRYYERDRDFSLPTLDDLQPNEGRVQQADYLIPAGTQSSGQDCLLSLILVTQNSAENLSRCLKSFVSMPEVEYIIVDDCSEKDDSFLQSRAAQKKLSAIRLFRTPWQNGIGQARNLAMREAKGKWLMFLEPDDWFTKGFVNHAVSLLAKETEADLIDFSWQAWSDERSQVLSVKTMPRQQKSVGQEIFKEWLSGKNGNLGLWSKALRKSFLEQNAITFLPHRVSDDFFFLVQLFTNAQHVCYSSFQSVSHSVEKTALDEPSPSLNEGAFLDAASSIAHMHSYLVKKGYNETSEEYTKILGAFGDGVYIPALLLHIYLCKKMGLQSPMTPEVAQALLSSDVFVEKCVANFKKLEHSVIEEDEDEEDESDE